MFEHGLQISKVEQTFKYEKDLTPLHYAAKEGFNKGIMILIGKGIENIDPLDSEGMTPLMHAMAHRKFDCAFTLVDFGAAVNIEDKYTRTPLMYACKAGQLELV